MMLVITSSYQAQFKVRFFGSISRADFMSVHCKIYLESLSQASAFRNKKRNVSITYKTHFIAFQS
jgi:hypothetical protein